MPLTTHKLWAIIDIGFICKSKKILRLREFGLSDKEAKLFYCQTAIWYRAGIYEIYGKIKRTVLHRISTVMDLKWNRRQIEN